MLETYAFFPFDDEKDQEEWPLLELTDATVFTYKRTGPAELEDLLDVQDRGPFRIEGNLSPMPDELSDIIRTKNPAKLYDEPLVVTQVMMYSIEQFENGDVKIWALGKCGWYSIVPSQKYNPTFKLMVEKGKLWLFLQDKYCEKYSGKGNNIKGTVGDLYSEYIKQEPSLPNVLAAAQLFEKHHRYLLFEMCGVRADTDMWPRTPLFRHLASKHAAELKTIRRSMACAKDRVENPVNVKKEASPTSPPPTSLARESLPLSRRPRVHNRSTSYFLFKLFSDHVGEHNLKPASVTKDLIVQFIYESFVFESLQRATANVHARAEDLLSMMEYPPPTMVYDWTKTPAYKELGFVRTSEGDALIRQEKLVPRFPKKVENSDEDEDEDEDDEGVGRSSGASAPGSLRIPIKRPGPTKGKSPGRVPARLQVSNSIEDNDNDSALGYTPAAVSGNQKRVFDEFLSPRNAAKRPRTRIATTAESSARSSTTSSTPSLRLGSSKPPISAIFPPAVRPNRPGGHWQCEISGCNLSILDTDTAENLQLIEQHYAEHAKIIKQAIDVIGGGEILPDRPRHHVDNLLAKIERMAKTWEISKQAPLTSLQLGLPGPESAPAASGASGV